MAAAIYSSSKVYNHEPNIIYVTVSELLDASVDATGFTVSVNAGGNVVSSVSVAQGSDQIEIVLSVDIIETDTLTVAYAGAGDMVSATGGEGLTIFTAQAITNEVYIDVADCSAALFTGAVVASGISISYNAIGPYTYISEHQLQTPSILRTEINKAGLYVADDRRGTWSKIQAVRDAILASL